MGAYLSEPITEKFSSDETNKYLACGASSMQGWRMSQEDAHNCKLDFDENASLFAVYDGHGGAEVALYCAKKLPAFLKNLEEYKKGNFEQALRDAFIGFDATLTDESVVEELKKLIPVDKRDGESETEEDCEDGEDDIEDLAELCQESRMPLNELLEKYKDAKNNPLLSKLKKGEASSSKPISPFLRGRRNQQCDQDGAGASSSSSSSEARPIETRRKLIDDHEDAHVSSSSAMSKQKNNEKIANEASSTSISSGSSSVNEASGTSNGPTSSNEAKSIKFLDKLNCNSPDSSSTNNKQSMQQAETSATSTSETSNQVKSIANGEVSESKNVSQENEISTNSATKSEAKSESVSSSSNSATKIENGEVSSNTIPPEKTLNNISSTNDCSSKKGLPDLGDDDSSSDDDEDGSYNEEKSSTEDGDDCEMPETDEEETDEDDDGLYPDDDEDLFLNNMIEGPGSSSGCTAVVTLMVKNELYVANAGDSRCVVCRNGEALEMSIDHKPEDVEELERIKKAGGRVTVDGRVNGGLNLSRAIGDHAYKMNTKIKPEEQMISAMPDIKKIEISPEDEFMVIACDGIWNFLSSEDVVQFVKVRLAENPEKISTICEELFTNCLAANTMGDGTGCDNMTAVIVQFKQNLTDNKADVTKKRSASPAPETNDITHKRIKTDQESTSIETSMT